MKIISFYQLSYMLIPLGITWFIYSSWTKNKKEVALATFRMVLQLLMVGYILRYIFGSKDSVLGFCVILIMISASSFIALRNVKDRDRKNYLHFFISVLLGSSFNLFLVFYFVLELHPFYQPRYIIPLSGMVFANAMNALSLTAERFENEIKNHNYEMARAISYKASLIPQINSFFAVGIVSLPGLMTGQILSGVDPIIAVRYQIVIMGMILGSAAMSTAIYLFLQKVR